MRIFGRITTTKENILNITSDILKIDLMVYEDNNHCHFVGEPLREYKNLSSFRYVMNKKCKEIIGLANQYSIKLLDEEAEWREYLCKGDKKNSQIKPDVMINNIELDINKYNELFHQNQKEFKQDKHVKTIWRDFEKDIQENNPELFKSNNVDTLYENIGKALFDYYIVKDKMFQSPNIMRNIITTIIARNKVGNLNKIHTIYDENGEAIIETERRLKMKEIIVKQWLPH